VQWKRETDEEQLKWQTNSYLGLRKNSIHRRLNGKRRYSTACSCAGHPAELLRQDIDVPKRLLAKWLKARGYEGNFRENLRRNYLFRKQVLAIFDELVGSQRTRARLN